MWLSNLHILIVNSTLFTFSHFLKTYDCHDDIWVGVWFLARNIYISRLCYDVSVRLSVTFVHCGHRVQWIPDTFACLDRWMSLLLIDNASPGSSDGMKRGGMEKLVIVAISHILRTESLDRKHVTVLFI